MTFDFVYAAALECDETSLGGWFLELMPLCLAAIALSACCQQRASVGQVDVHHGLTIRNATVINILEEHEVFTCSSCPPRLTNT